MKKYGLVIVACVFASTPALANSIQCSSYDGRLGYKFTQSDGGPAMNQELEVNYDGKALISTSSFGGAQVELATANFSDQRIWTGKSATIGHYEKTEYVINLTVKSLADETTIFNDVVLCLSNRYIGVPIP